MQMSEQMDEIAKAMCKFQGELPNCAKDTKGYGYKYAKFENGVDVIKPIMAKHGLFFTQACGECHSVINIETMIMHTSGQYFLAKTSLPLEKLNKMNLAQSAGANISYAKRYSLFASVGLATEDEDTDCSDAMVGKKNVVDVSIDRQPLIKEIKGYISKYSINPSVTDEWESKSGAPLDEMGVYWLQKILNGLKNKYSNQASNESIGDAA